MEEALRAFLKVDTGVIAVCGGRVEWVTRPQASQLPAVVLTLVSARPDRTYAGRSTLKPHRVQCGCWATTYAAANALADAVVAAAERLPSGVLTGAFVELERDDVDQSDTPTLNCKIVDLAVWSTEA